MRKTIDFFVSYVSADRPWAEWISWQLEQAGYATWLMTRDLRPGANLVREMDEAVRAAHRVIAVLSPAYLESPWAAAEWTAALALAKDATASHRELVPIRVRAVDVTGPLAAVVHIDLVGMAEARAQEVLLRELGSTRAAHPAGQGSPGGPPTVGRERPAYPGSGALIWNVPLVPRVSWDDSAGLDRLAQRLSARADATATQVLALEGLAGIGKSLLAARFASEHRDDYDVVWWIRAQDTATRLEDYAGLALTLGLVGADEADQALAVAATRLWLERSRRWLMIFDDAPGPEAIRDLVPNGIAGHVLITARRQAAWESVGGESLVLSQLSRLDSVAFLVTTTGDPDRQYADAIATILGDLPLALEQAAAYVNHQAISLADYLAQLRDPSGEFMDAVELAVGERAVAAAVGLAFRQLDAAPITRDLLNICAYLAPERIPRELLEASAVASNISLNRGEFDGAIERLLAYALLAASDEETFSMHSLVGQLTRRHAGADALRAIAGAITGVDRVFPTDPRQPDRWPSCQRLLPHALRAAEYAEDLGASPEMTAEILARVAAYEGSRADFAAARQLLERALKIQEPACGRESPEVARTLGQLGDVLQQQGDLYGARAYHERSLAILETVYGPEHPDVAITLGNLGKVLQQQGDLYGARAYQERSLAILETVYGPEHPDVAITLGNLGKVLQQQGDLYGARAFQERSLAILETVYGPEHPDVAITLGNLGKVLQQQGDLYGARAYQERALQVKEAVYGPAHPDIARTLINLGKVLYRQGDLAGALTHHERALAILEAVYGPDHPQVALVLGRLAAVSAGTRPAFGGA